MLNIKLPKNHSVEKFQMNSEIAVKINTIEFFYFDILLKSRKALKIKRTFVNISFFTGCSLNIVFFLKIL